MIAASMKRFAALTNSIQHMQVLAGAWAFFAGNVGLALVQQHGGDKVIRIGDTPGKRVRIRAEDGSLVLPNSKARVGFAIGGRDDAGPSSEERRMASLNGSEPCTAAARRKPGGRTFNTAATAPSLMTSGPDPTRSTSMSIRSLILPAAILAALAVQPVTAAEPAQPGPGAGPGSQPVVLSEAYERIATHAAAMDTNQDGIIDQAELKAFHEQRRAERKQRQAMRAAERFAAKDSDHDGKVTVEEFVAARKARLAALDTDGDGVLSREEMRRGHDKMREGRRERMRQHQHGAMHDEAAVED